MFFQRASDESWVKYLLSSGLITVDELQAMRGNQNQTDVTDLLARHSERFDTQSWLNQALQHDRFHFIPLRTIEAGELQALQQHHPLLVARCLKENILPVSFVHQILYLGLLRYDAEFRELDEICRAVPPDVLVCLVPLTPQEFVRFRQQIRSLFRT